MLSEATFVGGAVLAVALALALDGFSGAWAFTAGGLALGALATAAGGAISTDIATSTTTVAIWSIAETTRDLALCEEPPIATPLASRPYRGACAPTPPQRLPSGPAGFPVPRVSGSRPISRTCGRRAGCYRFHGERVGRTCRREPHRLNEITSRRWQVVSLEG